MTLATDLATLARDNRRALRPVDATLPRIVASSEEPLVRLAHAYSGRVALAAAGAAALLYSLFVLMVWWNPHGMIAGPFDDDGGNHWWLTTFEAGAAVWRLVMLVLLASVVGRRLADRAFDRAVQRGDTHARGRRLVAGADRTMRVLAVVGATAAGATLTAGWFLFGGDQPWYPSWDAAGEGVLAAQTVVALVAAVVVVAALALARPRGLVRALAHPIAIPLAVLAGAAVLTVAFATDPGDVLTAFMQDKQPTQLLRVVLALAGTLALGALVAAIVERLDRQK